MNKTSNKNIQIDLINLQKLYPDLPIKDLVPEILFIHDLSDKVQISAKHVRDLENVEMVTAREL